MADWTPNHDWARALVNRQNTGTTTSSAMAVIGAGKAAKRLADILKLINVDHIKVRLRYSRKRGACGMHPFGQSPHPLVQGGQSKGHKRQPSRPQIRAHGPAAWSTLRQR